MAKKGITVSLAAAMLVLVSQSPHAQTAESYVWQSVAIRGGGFVPGLVFGTAEKNVLYARTDMAGAYRWDETKYGWIPIMDWLTRPDMKYIGVESIAPDPVDANVVYMAVGTYTSSGNGQIIRSADRGNTWTRYNIATPMGGNADGRSLGERLMVDPNKTSILYFGSRTAGLWTSTDSAATWAKVASFPVTGTNPYGLSFVVFDKKSGTAGSGSSTIYVGVAATTAGTNLYRSTDAGATWTLVTGTSPPSGLMPHHGVLASDGNLWIAYNSSSGPNSISSGAVWKLNTATDAWTNVNPAGHGGGIGGISVSASDPNYALASTLDWWAPDEMYRTTNGGTSWTAIGRSATHDPNGAQYLCFGPANCSSSALSSAGWAGDIEIDPFNQSRAFYVTGQGVWSSKNSDAASGIVWSFEDKDFEETVGLDLTSSVKTAIFAVVGDIGIIRTATDALDTPSPTGMVTNPKFGNGNSVDFAGLNPNIVADCGNGTPSGGYSTDNGITWKPFASQAGGSKVAVGADGSVFVWGQNYSTDNGATWKACAGLSGSPRIASDRVNPKKFYGFASGTLYASTDGAATFTAATTGLSGSGRAAAVFGMEGEVWVAAGSNLYHSKSSGASATKVAGPSQVYSVGFGKAAPGASYPAVYIIGTVSSISGVFRSTDEGATWLRVNDDQHQYGQMDNVAGDEDYYGRVFVTTQGRGIPYGQPGTPAPTGGSTGSTGGTTGSVGGTTAAAGGSGGSRGGNTGSSGGTTAGAGGSGGSRGGSTGASGGTTSAAGGSTVSGGGSTGASSATTSAGGRSTVSGGGSTGASSGTTSAAGGSTLPGGGTTAATGGTTTAAGGSAQSGGGTTAATGGSSTANAGGVTTGAGGSSVPAGGTTAAAGGSTASKGAAGCSCSTVDSRGGSRWACLWMLTLLMAIVRRRRR
jgi:MYXO-CTERM domain-containing protein